MPDSAADILADVQHDVATLHRDGVVSRKGASPRAWAEAMREDITTAFWEAIQGPGGAVRRGLRRWCVEIQPQNLGGLVDLVTHPWVVGLCEAMLGPDYQIVEVGFDTPFQGAKYQPWRRDLPLPAESWRDRRITSLAFNLTGVDVTPDMGPFEVAPSTQWDHGRRRSARAVPRPRAVAPLRRAGDAQVPADGRHLLPLRPDGSPRHRPRLAGRPPRAGAGRRRAGAGHAALHDMMVTPEFHASLPAAVRDHLVCRIVPELVPVTQKYDIERLVMGTG